MRKITYNNTIRFCVSQALAESIHTAAVREGQNVSEFCRAVLRDHIKIRRKTLHWVRTIMDIGAINYPLKRFHDKLA